MAFTVTNSVQNSNFSIRLTFSLPPRALGDGNFADALNPINYLIKSPSAATAPTSNINTVPGDPLSIDLVFTQILNTGNYLVQVGPNIESAGNLPESIGIITNLTVPIDISIPQSLTVGIDAQTSETQLMDNFNLALRGDNWTALISSLAVGQQAISENSEAVFNQLFYSTAQGQYLDKKMAEINLTRPINFGLNDEVFREVGLVTKNHKLLNSSIWKILDAYYGDNEVKVFQETTTFQPWALSNGQQLFIQIDGFPMIKATFNTANFTDIANATAIECAGVINRAFTLNNINAYAIDYFNPEDSNTYLRIFSNTYSLAADVRILGGEAQNEFLFALLVGRSLGELPTVPTWHIVPQGNGIVRMTYYAGPTPDISGVQVGDYLNFYGTTTTNRGTWVITAIYVDPVSNTYWFEFFNLNGVTETFIESTNTDLMFFRPVRGSVQKGYVV